MFRTHRLLGFATLAAVLLGTASLNASEAKLQGEIFGTTYSIKVRDADEVDADQLQHRIVERLDEIDERMSTYRQDSDLSRFNRAEANDWFSVDAETAKVVRRALDLSVETEGAFDVTVGPAVRLWNFGAEAEGAFVVPSAEQIQEVREWIGHPKLECRLEPPALRKSVAGLHVDLSAIAKGYAVDAVSELLTDVDAYMVEIGGEVRVHGQHADGSPWRIGLELPTKHDRRVDSIVSLHDEAMATSGDYRNYHEHGGVSYSHTIDPVTARPVEHSLASVTVVADDCATADALATAILVMGSEKGEAWAATNGIRAQFVSRVDNDFQRSSTPGFPEPDIQPTEDEMNVDANSSYLGMFVVTAVVFGIAVLAMSVGTIIANRRLQGSCGGMAGLKDAGGKTICEMCTKPSPECSGEPPVASSTADGAT